MLKTLERRWSEMPKNDISLTQNDMSLTQVVEDYLSDLRIQRKSPKTTSFYLRNLRLFTKWMKRHGYKGILRDLNLVTAKQYIWYLEEEHRTYQGHPFTPEQDEGLPQRVQLSKQLHCLQPSRI
jgi:hypothetical protein